MTKAAGTESVGLVQQFVERAGQLYSLPAVAAEVLRLANQPQIDPRAIKDCLERDPALSARILRVVNSSLFGPSRPVTDLSQALTLLGIRPLKMLVLGFSLPKELFAGLEADVLRRYWRLALVKAVAARELAEQFWHVPGDEPFLAGLIQDIGILALVQQLGEPYLKLLAHVQSQGDPLAPAELAALGFDHLVLSARLLMHWGLPAGMAAAISVPPDEDRIHMLAERERTLPRMLHLAELLARLIEHPSGPAIQQLLAVGQRYCGLSFDRLEPVVATLQRKVSDLADVLSLELPEGRNYLELLLDAQRALADESMQAAAVLAAPRPEDELLALTGRLQQELAAAARRPSVAAAPAAPLLVPTNVQTSHAAAARPRAAAAPRRRAPAVDAAEPELVARVAAAAQHCRQHRGPLSLAIFEIDRFGDVLLQLSAVGMAEAIHSLRSALAAWCSQAAPALLVGDSRLAMLWEDCPRSDAVRTARHALAEVKPWSQSSLLLTGGLSLSCGIATVEIAPLNFSPDAFVTAAERCLSGAQLSGGDTVKSIAF